MPDFKTISDFRKDNRTAIRRVCVEFVGVCRELELFSAALVAIDGSKFKAVNSRDKNFTKKSVQTPVRKDADEHRSVSCKAVAHPVPWTQVCLTRRGLIEIAACHA